MHPRLAPIVTCVALVAAACGGGGAGDLATGSTAGPTAAPADEPASPQDGSVAAEETEPTGAPSFGGLVSGDLTSVVGDGWSAVAIDEGTKPSLALNAEGVPGLAWLFEDLGEGFVAYASASNGWLPERFVEGYFYGPIGLDYDPGGVAHIAYHDHQANTFQENLGDLAYARRGSSGWELQAAPSDGHDGWDSTIHVGADGTVHAAGVDPVQFGRVEGLEYYRLVDGTWQVELIGSGPLEYEWNVDLQVAPDGSAGVTYFQTGTADLAFAQRAADGTWSIETVDSEGDVGRFSSFAYDAGGAAHVSYWVADTGEVRYATNAGGRWSVETVGTLDAVQIGFEGARRITTIDLDADGVPHVAFSDETGIWLAARTAPGTWLTEQLVQAAARPLGQLVSMELDATGTPHLSFFEVTGNGPLSGVVAYLTAG